METPETMPFPCEKCGACCRHLTGIEETSHLDRGDGICKYYNESTKECVINDFKPEICNVTKMYKRYKDKMTWEEYVKYSKECCQKLRDFEKGKK